jgi:alpha-L-rhamnosidase
MRMILSALLVFAGSAGADVKVANLRCEYLSAPVGMDNAQPKLSWIMESDARAQCQSAYQVLIASSEEVLNRGKGDLWDSGKTLSKTSLGVLYQGLPLASAARYWWKVRVWDKTEKCSAWSAATTFLTGKLKPADWQGKWIGADGDTKHSAVYLQRNIRINKPVQHATVFFSGLGYSELAIDGKKVSEDVVGPGFTTYNKRTPYLAFDITDRFGEPGRHVLDVILADGWYGLSNDPWVHKFEQNVYVDKPKLLLDLHLQHSDGTETIIVSDEEWQWSRGQVTRSWIAQENIDLRKHMRQWQNVKEVNGPEGKLVRQKEYPNRIINEVTPVAFEYDAGKKTATLDLGREITGWPRFTTQGGAGTELTISTIAVGTPADDGVPGFPPRPSQFILAGTGVRETYEPRFCTGGFRRVSVSGLTREPKVSDMVGCEVSSMYTPCGDFACSDERVNWLQDCVRRTVVSYTTFLPNDPVREWKAWTEDIQNMFWSAVYLFDSRAMYLRWQYDLLDGQNTEGNFPNIAPGPGYDSYNSPWWGGCAVWLPWEWYQYYGDDRLLRESYPAMKRYVDYLDTVAVDGLQQWGLGDWLPVEETPVSLINTPAHVLYADIVSRTATLLGHIEDARRYSDVAARVRGVFNKAFLDPATGIYGKPGWQVRKGNWKPPESLSASHRVWWTGDRPATQAGQIMALALDIVPAQQRGLAEQALLKEIDAHDGRLSTGFVSTPYLLRVLADLAPEVGWRMTTTSEFPSWLSMTRGSGSDVMKETWAGGQALMPSLGGNIVAWHMESLAGIRPDPTEPGFKRIIIKPNVIGDLTWVKAHHDSPYGRITSHWKRDGDTLTMKVTIPANTTATVYVPARDAESVTESGKPATQARGVKFLRMGGNVAVCSVGSGSYEFKSKMK